MNRVCSSRISSADTAGDSPEMCMQNGEIPQQPPLPRTRAMDSRASHETHRAAGFASLPAPPAPILAKCGPAASRVTVTGAAAKAPDGAGAVDRAGIVVAPVPLADGPGIAGLEINVSKTVRRRNTLSTYGLQSDTGRCYSRSRQSGSPPYAQTAVRVSEPVRASSRRHPVSARGDRSRHQPFPAGAGTRSGDRRDVSLSPVPAAQTSRHRNTQAPTRQARVVATACDNRASRIRRDRVAHRPA